MRRSTQRSGQAQELGGPERSGAPERPDAWVWQRAKSGRFSTRAGDRLGNTGEEVLCTSSHRRSPARPPGRRGNTHNRVSNRVSNRISNRVSDNL